MGLFDTGVRIKASDYLDRCKATVRKNGELGFAENAAKLMKLDRDSRILLSEQPGGDLAAVVRKEPGDADGFAVKENGGYCSINLRAYFEQTGVPYADEAQRVIFDIVETSEEFEGSKVFKLTKRVRKRV